MIFNFTRAAPLSTGPNFQVFGWLSNMQISGKVVPAEQNQQGNLTGHSMFSLMVSNDAVRGRIF